MKGVDLFVDLLQCDSFEGSVGIGVGNGAPHLEGDFGHSLNDSPTQWGHVAPDVLDRAPSDVFGQVCTSFELGKHEENAHELPELITLRSGGDLAPNRSFDFVGQPVDGGVGIGNFSADRGIRGEKGIGRLCQRFRDQVEQNGDSAVHLRYRTPCLHRAEEYPDRLQEFSKSSRSGYLGVASASPGPTRISSGGREASLRSQGSGWSQRSLGVAPVGSANGAVKFGAPTPADSSGASVIHLLNEAPRSRYHRRAVLISGMGFFTDAYDLFVISTVAALVKSQWHLGTTTTSWVTGAAVLGAFIGAFVFGRLADKLGRKHIYALVAAVMIVGALASALSPNVTWLIVARFVLGLGIGGDYPVSAVLMSEYSNRQDRGRYVGLVFSMQALGLIVGPLVGLTLLPSGLSHEVVWRLLLALGAVPAGAVVYLRAKMPESPRFQIRMNGNAKQAVEEMAAFSEGVVNATGDAAAGGHHPESPRRGIERRAASRVLTNRRMVRLLLGTAGTWFLFDYAYYGNTLSLPAILKGVDAHATLEANLAWSLLLFVAFAVPGYFLAAMRMDKIGHRRLQLIGFTLMTVAFAVLGAIKGMTTIVPLFLIGFGISYFFIEFGPNTTTFVLPSELFPVDRRTTGHGIAAGVGKFGAFIGAFLVPRLEQSLGLRGMLGVAAAASLLGLCLTFLLPEPAGRTLEEISGEDAPLLEGASGAMAANDRCTAQASPEVLAVERAVF